ncbi:MAG TPA: FIST C-terminal domain-containing protein [Methylophilaceae bacterium]|nr:FIST C-terminal domain-containing protein [Methylophilaceae bacterium]
MGKMKVATGLATGTEPVPELAARAVAKAMKAAEINVASSVLLFLTSEFARDPAPALRAAAKAASCIQVMGCSAPGILTEEDWILDAPAAAAMVFGEGAGLQPAANVKTPQLLLTLAAPNAINRTWMSAPGLRFGGVSGDAMGQGPFSVWQNGKGAVAGHCEAIISGVTSVIAPAHGLRMLSDPMPVKGIEGHDLRVLGDGPALSALQHACMGVKGISGDALPLHSLMAVFADSEAMIVQGKYQLAALVSGNENDGSVTLAKKVEKGQWLGWAIRDAEAAQFNLRQTANQLASQLPARPDFGLMFSCLGRGPYFYGGVDRDLVLLRQLFPGMPLIGFYGNGEIAPVNGISELLQYSAVLGLFASESR